jgi:hypothetical protein
MADERKLTQKQKEARDSLPPELLSVFDDLVAEYQFFAMKHHGSPFVSYIVLADLIRAGWRPSGEAFRVFTKDNE